MALQKRRRTDSTYDWREDGEQVKFLKADGTVNLTLWNEFKDKIQKATSFEELYAAFKVPVLTPSAPISAFYAMLDGK